MRTLTRKERERLNASLHLVPQAVIDVAESYDFAHRNKTLHEDLHEQRLLAIKDYVDMVLEYKESFNGQK